MLLVESMWVFGCIRGQRSSSALILPFVYSCVRVHMHIHICPRMWKPRSLQELVLSFHHVGLGTKLRLSGLVMGALFGCIVAGATHHDKGHLRKEEFIWA